MNFSLFNRKPSNKPVQPVKKPVKPVKPSRSPVKPTPTYGLDKPPVGPITLGSNIPTAPWNDVNYAHDSCDPGHVMFNCQECCSQIADNPASWSEACGCGGSINESLLNSVIKRFQKLAGIKKQKNK